jgi:DNA-directed RNA polymerase specialized sigma24 family protein
MTQALDTIRETPPVAPLRKVRPDGDPYRRPDEVERAIAVLLQLPAGQVAERSQIEDPEHPDYVPAECVLYFVRRLAPDADKDALNRLFAALRQRVLRAVPVSARRVAGSAKLAERATDLEVRDAVMDKFQELLCGDRREYDPRLDFYECRFNAALARLRATARRDVRRDESCREPAAFGVPAEPSADVESALAAMRGSGDGEGIDFLYRSKLRAAISSLPPDERRVVELLLDEVPIDSQDKEVFTIVKALGCSEKTVRNRRDRAFQRLRDAMNEEDDV